MGDQREGGMTCQALKKAKPFLAIVSLQFGYSGMYIISMISLKRGMSHYILATYRHVVATIVIAPFAIVLERFLSDLIFHYMYIYLSCVVIFIFCNMLHAILIEQDTFPLSIYTNIINQYISFACFLQENKTQDDFSHFPENCGARFPGVML